MPPLHATLRDAVAFISGCLADPAPDIDQALDSVMADLEHADPLTLVAAFGGLAVNLVGELADHTTDSRADYWRTRATGITRRLTEMENDRGTK